MEKIKNPLHNLYSSNIKNISLLIGKNGTGKTTILDIIGMNRSDRLKVSFSRNQEILDTYFLLYYLYKDSGGKDIYGIEFIGDSIFGEVITNCEIGSYRDYNDSKVSIGIQFFYDGNKFIDTMKHFFSSYKTEHDKLSQYLNIIHSNHKRGYSDRITYDYRATQQEDDDYLAKRIYFGTADEALKYKTIYELKNDNMVEFLNRSAMLKIEDSIDYEIRRIEMPEDVYKQYMDKLEDYLLIRDRGIKILNPKKAKNETKKQMTNVQKKEKYILNFLSRYILDEFIDGVCTIINDNMKRPFKRSPSDDRPEKNSIPIDFSNKLHIRYIEGLGVQDSSFSMFGRPTDFEIEIENLYGLIKLYNPKGIVNDFNKCYESLKRISRYLYSRIEAQYDFGECGGYQMVMEDFLKLLIDLQPDYFNTDIITIPLIERQNGGKCNFDDNVYRILEFIREKRLIEKDFHNGIDNICSINYCKMSEGEHSLIDILSKVKYSAEKACADGLILLLLDEPDRALHPEWSRNFFSILIETLSKLKFNVQAIITTHSPYMLSDVFPQNAFLFERMGDNGELKIERLSERNRNYSCFGANIYDLMKNSFIMNNSMGEFATKQIQNIIKEISKINENTTSETLESIEFYIEIIGEPALKEVIGQKYRKKLRAIRMSKMNGNHEDILKVISNPEERERVRKLLRKDEERYND